MQRKFTTDIPSLHKSLSYRPELETPPNDQIKPRQGIQGGKQSLLGFASGLVAGLVGVFVGQPMDLVKVHQQIYGSNAKFDFGASRGAAPLNTIGKIKYLFRGIGPPLVTSGITQTINFGVYDNVLRYLRRDSRNVNEGSMLHYFIAGSAGGMSISFITSPASLIKIQLQTASGPLSYWTIFSRMASKGLIGGFYRAYLPDVLNQCFGRGVYMFSYEGLKRLMRSPEDLASGNLQPLPQRIFAGGMAGIMGWLAIFPLDVIKSRMMHDALSPADNRYTGMTDCFRKTYQNGGIRALYSGLLFTLLRAVPVASVILPTYDFTYHILSQYLTDLDEALPAGQS